MLTHRQKTCLDFISACIDANGRAPTLDEIVVHMKFKSKSRAHRMVTAIQERGFVRRLPHQTRGIEVIRRPSHSVAYFRFCDEAKTFVPFVPAAVRKTA